jgi:predicted helicase
VTDDDFDTFVPIASNETKATKARGQERAIFKIFGNGVNTARDSWVIDSDKKRLQSKVEYFLRKYDQSIDVGNLSPKIKLSRNLKVKFTSQHRESFQQNHISRYNYRPYFAPFGYLSNLLIDELGSVKLFGGSSSPGIAIPNGGEFRCLAAVGPIDFHFIGDSRVLGRAVLSSDGARLDNITDWGLDQFRAHYEAGAPSPLAGEGGRQSRPDEGLAQQGALKTKRGKSAEIGAGGSDPSSVVADATTPSPARGEGERPITKDAIFHYVYAVLHDPIYREKYAQNLKREFPRIPFYEDFWRWADWGETLMALHIGYETVEPWPLVRTDVADAKAAAAGLKPKPILRADHDHGIIVLDSETQLSGVPAEAWAYRLGNRSALEWILDQHKEKTPKDPTIRERFNTYRFADYKEKVVDLLARVTRVSVETMKIVETMRATHH